MTWWRGWRAYQRSERLQHHSSAWRDLYPALLALAIFLGALVGVLLPI